MALPPRLRRRLEAAELMQPGSLVSLASSEAEWAEVFGDLLTAGMEVAGEASEEAPARADEGIELLMELVRTAPDAARSVRARVSRIPAVAMAAFTFAKNAEDKMREELLAETDAPPVSTTTVFK